ncbi:HrpB1 family type III secretion system apparatus protein [Trinickia fusca]|uniref:HrpB1 family type III secretion system apparatus protein n=1 Tax=Trinickia fusca TaxID=2419777 RepID=A0A494X1H1_9BURK|nr:HrpB1 family type III secretion system apparatus protein [Trinickia fusca]RKP44565.1 hypothetical protein D7S89_22050 [Trinickia fusca]
MSELKDYLKCGDEILRGLVEIINLALIDKFPRSRIAVDDIEQLIGAVRLLCEPAPEFEMIGARLQIVRGDFIGAAQVFRELADKGHCLPNSRAMQIYCMSENGDGDWQVEANQMMQSETSDDAVRLLRTVVARNELNRAIEKAKATGEFEFPESLKTLVAERQSHEAEQAAQAQPVPSMIDPSLMGGQYMRL